MNRAYMKISLILCSFLLFSCCMIYTDGEQWEKDLRYSKLLHEDDGVNELLEKKGNPSLGVLCECCVGMIRLDFYDEKKPLSNVTFTADDAHYIALVAQRIAREMPYDRKIKVCEFSTDNARYIITPNGGELKTVKR